MRACLMVLVAGCICAGGLLWLNAPPAQFPEAEPFTIQKGETITEIAQSLREHGYIRSATFFQVVTRLYEADTSIPSGMHRFLRGGTLSIVEALKHKTSLVPLVTVTIPEGATVKDFDSRIVSAFSHLAPGSIEEAAGYQEGILFPDTYFFEPDATAHEIVALLTTTFDERYASLAMGSSTLTRHEVVVLASIVEKEGNDEESMRTIAGILLRRLSEDMPLQVDATYAYALNKTSAELTEEELRADTPWNTYSKRGLPSDPIGSPGLMALRAVLDPIETEYLYYLSDAQGEFHYARTFDEHRQNKAQYLK